MSPPRTVADLLAECLAHLGVARVWGAPVPGLDPAVVPAVGVDDTDLACLMADADGRLRAGWGAAAVPGRILHLSSRPGGTAQPHPIATAEELVAATGVLAGRDEPDTVALHLELELDGPVPDDLGPVGAAAPVVLTLDPAMAELDLVVVAGPGVVRGGHAGGLDRLARHAGLPVAEAYGARGLLRWDSPFAAGVVGLQADDAHLAGVTAAEVVVATGLDPAETPVAMLGRAVQEVPPWQLPALTARWAAAPGPPVRASGQRDALAPVLVAGYESESAPLHPARAALHLSGAAPEGAVVAGEAGRAGFWLARAAPTGIPGAVVVPSLRQPGAAAALALAARHAGRPAVGVTDGVDPATEAVVELARALGTGLEVQVWTPEGPRVDPSDHARVTTAAFTTERALIRTVGVATDDLGPITGIAGPVVAWGGLDT